MSNSIREKLIAAGIIIPASKNKDGSTHSNNQNKEKKQKVKKGAKSFASKVPKPRVNSENKLKLSKVDRAILQASSFGRGDSNHLQPEKIRLFVRRGTSVKSGAICDTCGSSTGILTKYSDTSVGPIVFCTVCKLKAFEANFGHADAMPLKVDHAHAQRAK
ncbi:hypothetical protein ACT262_003468 [Vibrio cholerae]